MNIEDKSLQEQIEELKKIPGKIKGEVFNTCVPHIREKEGEEGLKKVLEKMEELGCSLDLKKIKPLEMYPEYLSVVLIITAKSVFNWTEEDIFEMGYYAPRRSFIVRMLLKYLVSVETLFEKASLYWGRHYDFGEIESTEINEKEKWFVLRVKGYNFHPLICHFHAGYFKGITELCVKSKKVTVEETKCTHKGDSYHEYLLRWE